MVRRVLEASGIALLLMVLLYGWSNSPYSFSIESKFLRLSSILRSTFGMNGGGETALQTVWLVNAGSSGQLVSTNVDLENTRIADRHLIDSFLVRLNSFPNPKRIVLCDLLFDLPTIYDSSLAASMSSTPNLFVPQFTDATMASFRAIANSVHQGVVDYEITNSWWRLSDKINKFQLIDGQGRKSLPLKMYEFRGHQQANLAGGLVWMSDHALLNRITVDETIRSYNLTGPEGFHEVFPIRAALEDLRDNDEYAADKSGRELVVIGDFYNDTHATSFGNVPGPIINANLYASLMKGENRIRWTWVILVFVGFTFIIQYCLFNQTPRRLQQLERWISSYTGIVIGNILRFIPLTWALALILYFIYQTSIEIIASSVILSFLFWLRCCMINIRLLTTLPANTTLLRKISFVFTNKHHKHEV